MALNIPYLQESNFEQGTNVEWDSQTDTSGQLKFRHYSLLSKYNANSAVLTDSIGPIVPWRGAFCAEWFLSGTTNSAILVKATSVVLADTKIGFSQFMLFIGNDLKATADDTFTIFQLQGTANAAEGTVALKITAATQAVQIGAGQLESDVVFVKTIDRGRWINVELVTTKQVGAQTGTNVLFIDGTQVSTIVDSVNGTAVLRGVLGTQNVAATTTGHLFMDAFKYSSNAANAGTTRIGVPHDRYPQTVMVTKSTHLCLGTSEILNITLMGGASTNSILNVYDTDNADLQDDTDQVAVLPATGTAPQVADLANVPVTVKRGAYIQLAGTGGTVLSPNFALVEIGASQGWGSHGRVRQLGSKKSINLNPEAGSQ